MTDLRHDANQKMVQEIVTLYRSGYLNLSPGFQRDSVWTKADRTKLIDSIFRNYPLPAIFLYRRHENGAIIYDVIDGKQRIESVLMYMGVIRGNRFEVPLQLEGDERAQRYGWNALGRKRKQERLLGYNLRTIEVDGDFSDIIDIFVRINSTGKALTSAERRHARYYNSEFLRAAARLAEKYTDFFLREKILSAGQIARMKHVELMCELLVSIYKEDVINKKTALDQVMQKGSITSRETKTVVRRTSRALNRTRKTFPNLASTRFNRISDFYTLVVLVAKFEKEKLILTDRRRNRLAQDMLTAFSTGVDGVRLRQKRAEGFKPGEELYREYLLTVLEGTDQILQRQQREKILRGLLQSLFERKDARRAFSREQRRILWNTADYRKCKVKGCKNALTWSDFTIDHINPYSKGGRTDLTNAALMCQKHNSSKGARAA